jgi:putative ABC transport system permease protein
MRACLRTVGSRCWAMLRRNRLDREFDEELTTHLELLVEEGVRRGMSPADARNAALRKLGRPAALREAHREQRGMPTLETLWQDIRHSFRLFSRTPIVTVTALLTIALGVGGSTAVFSVVYAVMLRPLPYPAPDRLIELFEDNPRASRPMMRVSTLNYLSWVERTASMEALATFQGASFNLTDHGQPERLPGSAISASLFSVLGLPPLAGRGFRVEDEQQGAPRVAVIAEALWRRRFGSDAAIVGESITLNGERHQVIGVVPSGFREVGRAQASAADDAQIFVPLAIDQARENRGNRVMRVVGRLRRGVSLDRARDDMRRIAAAMEEEFPATNRGWSVRLETLYSTMLDERVRPSLLMLLVAVGVVLLIACANVANVLLARGLSRQREFALRTALGAGRSRLIRQLVTESVSIAVVSGACGLVFAVFAVQSLRVMLPTTLPRINEISVDVTVLGVGLLLSLTCGLFMGLVPAVRASRVALVPSLVQSRKGVAGSSRTLSRHAIVVGQMALATMLLVSAALLLQSIVRLQHVRPGFEPAGVITARISLPRAQYPDAARTWGFWRRLLESLDGAPQIQSAAVGITAPFAPGVRADGRARDYRRAPASSDEGITAVEHVVSPDYFRALSVPLLAGRSFGPQDGLGTLPVAIVSDRVARQLWADKSPIGQTLEWNRARQYEVVGIVGDIRGSDGRGCCGGGLDREPTAAVYLSATQLPQNTMTVLMRTSGEFSAIAPAIARAVRDLDPAQPVYQVRRLDGWVDESTAQPRFATMLTGGFALVAVVLAAVGVYGVLSYSVTQRTQEIGVRMAVGADRAQILSLVLRGGMAWALSGIAIGLLGALALSRVLATLLFDIAPRDPVTFSAVGGIVALVAMLACYIPAARATRIDPMVALRTE